MTLRIDRRTFVLTGTLGLGAFAIPGFARAFVLGETSGFTHGVASGEPGADSMLLWTRYVPPGGGEAKLRAEIAATPDFAKIVTGGEMITGPWRDHTAKIVVTGLQPATDYHYRFIAPDGGISMTGRTKTLPIGLAKRWTAAIFSCSNLAFGHFNAYAHAAARPDVDLAVHLGDYLYEYKPGVYPSAKGAIASRIPLPLHECLALADYRLRYASYRSDPDLQRLHAVKPMIVQCDDHESANNSWDGGAENHQADEGDWGDRRAASERAFREWMPVSDVPWARYDVGTLASLFRTESRLHRSRSPEYGPLFLAPDPVKALTEFRDGAWHESGATMLGSEQEAWLARSLRQSVKAGQRWQVTAFGTIMGRLSAPAEAMSWLDPDAPARVRAYVQAGVTAGKLGLPTDLDNWGGYPAARARFLKSAQATGANLITICGDSHNGWAFDLGQDGKPAGVEFAGMSVTSNGYEGSVRTDPRTVAAAMRARNPELKWCDTSRRGYMALTLTPERASNSWVFVDTIAERTPGASVGHTAVVSRGRNAIG